MNDPYRDELLALRVENERLRRRLAVHERPRATRAIVSGAAIGGSSVGAWYLLAPLLNSAGDRAFVVGVAGAVALLALDVFALIRLARWATPRVEDE